MFDFGTRTSERGQGYIIVRRVRHLAVGGYRKSGPPSYVFTLNHAGY